MEYLKFIQYWTLTGFIMHFISYMAYEFIKKHKTDPQFIETWDKIKLLGNTRTYITTLVLYLLTGPITIAYLIYYIINKHINSNHGTLS